MQIDWLTVGAQILNFLILVALLKHFLYRPVIDAMDRREKRLAQQLRDAEQREQQAEARAREFQDRSDEVERRRQELLEEARRQAETERHDRLQEARAEVEAQRDRWRTQLEEEWEDVRATIGRRLAGAVTEAARRVLADLADTDLEHAMSRAFQRRLAALDAASRQAIEDAAGPVEVATAFEPDDEVRAALTGAVKEALGRDVRFVRGDGLIGGIELRARGWTMSWTVAEYLRDVEHQVAEIIAAAPHPVER